VDLAAPGAVEVPLTLGVEERQSLELPLPVCPDGSPQAEFVTEEEGPGSSPLDAAIERLDGAIQGEPLHAHVGAGGPP
jgi:hypothetical protein